MITNLIVPGLDGSGDQHWQTWLEARLPNAVRVKQHDWAVPDLAAWSARVRYSISQQPGKVRIIAHSFGVLAAVQAGADYRHRIAGALLVAPPDPEKFGVSDLLPSRSLGFPALLVASFNDPWMTASRAAAWAIRWDAQILNLGPAGHINSASGHGPWPGVFLLLDRLGTLERRNDTVLRGAVPNRRPAPLAA